jgi:hypothetical protein
MAGPRTHRAAHDFQREQIDFCAINHAALASLGNLLTRWLPDGRRIGREWLARNPIRADRTPGSFKVNLRTGQWSDFATGDKRLCPTGRARGMGARLARA